MAAASPSCRLFISILLLSSTLCHSFFLSNYHNLVSLSHSLTSRVAALRAARGDAQGASRARSLAKNIERAMGLGFYKFAFNVGWDFLKNQSWRDTMSPRTLTAVLSDLYGLLGPLGEFSRINSDAERVAWIGRNYQNILKVSKSLFLRLLEASRRSGPLREVLEALRKEVMEGDMLKDCLELGATDLRGLIQILKDISLGFASTSTKTEL